MSDLLERLRTAERGSAKLSAEVLTAVTGGRHVVSVIGEIVRLGEPSERNVPSVTQSIDAAWALAESTGRISQVDPLAVSGGYRVVVWHIPSGIYLKGCGSTPALAICAALVAYRSGTAERGRFGG